MIISMERPTFKRAKRILALHYGSESFKTRRLCQFFSNPAGLTKDQSIIEEAARIIQLRERLGYQVTNESIDATMAAQVHSRNKMHNGKKAAPTSEVCVTCKQQLETDGWQVSTVRIFACAGDCALIANFYYTVNGAARESCRGFESMYGRHIADLSPPESSAAMLSYMLHLSASRHKRRENNARQRNPTYSPV